MKWGGGKKNRSCMEESKAKKATWDPKYNPITDIHKNVQDNKHISCVQYILPKQASKITF